MLFHKKLNPRILKGLRFYELVMINKNCTLSKSKNKTVNYIHIAPCGDWWIGSDIYAAKHNPTDYILSLPLPNNFDQTILTNTPNSKFQHAYDKKSLSILLSKND